MSENLKQIDPAALGTITTGRVLCDFGKVHEAMEWVMGCPIWTHEIPSMRGKITKAVLEQFPDLPTEKPSDWQSEAARLRARYGEMVGVRQGTEQRTKSPLESLDPEKTIVAVIPPHPETL